MGELTALVDTSVLMDLGSVGLAAAVPGRWGVSAISVGELEAGVLLARDRDVRAARLRRLGDVMAEAPILVVDRTVAARFGELQAVSGRVTTNDLWIAATNDLWIAATALAHGLTLYTADEHQAALPIVRTALAG